MKATTNIFFLKKKKEEELSLGYLHKCVSLKVEKLYMCYCYLLKKDK